MKADW